MEVWLIFIGMMLVTYSVRLSVIGFLGQDGMPEVLRRALRYVPPAALAALIFPDLLLRGGALDISPGNVRLLAAMGATLVAWRTRNALLSIGAGMILLWILQAVLPLP